jgi:uncharacterized protein (DUF849 family)
MLQACLNGGLDKTAHPGVPVTADELAADAAAVVAAGAEALHVHVRADDGAETLAPAAVARTLAAIRRRVPGVPVGLGTGAWIAPGGRARHADLRAWCVRPDYASVNLGEDDALEVVELLHQGGTPVEAGLWNTADARRFVAEVEPRACVRLLVEMTDDDPRTALAEARAVLDVLAAAGSRLPVLLHGEGGSVWACIEAAWRLGLATRVGFEDGRRLPTDELAPDNAALVRAALALRGG